MRVPLNELPDVARQVLELSYSKASKDKATLVALHGDLGAGKTTFAQALAKELGVADSVVSPTYVLMKKYRTPNPTFHTLVHVDAYRLEKPEEFAALKPQEFLGDPGCLVMIEWPEKLGVLLPTPDLTLDFSSKDAGEGERYIEMI